MTPHSRPFTRWILLAITAILACSSPKKGPEYLPSLEREPPPLRTVAPEEPLPIEPETPPTALEKVEDLRVRVGLYTDLGSFDMPCCQEGLWALAGGKGMPLKARFKVEPSADRVKASVYRFQVAALRSQEQADRMSERLRKGLGMPVDSRFDAETGLYRVRVGRFKSRESARQRLSTLRSKGVSEAWVVSEGGEVENPSLRLILEGKKYRIEGRELILESRESGEIQWKGKRYRGRLHLFLTDRGALNVVNEVPLEAYLRSVVSREIGPAQYPWIEALKAQAVAARTYTLHNLGGFSEEGYDICGTPKCQVYGGIGAEHPLSDRAVRETAGEALLWKGEPINALYSASCGGHTENVESVFPLKKEEYLRGLACIEKGPTSLRGVQSLDTITRELIPVGQQNNARAQFANRLRHLANLAGLPSVDRSLEGLSGESIRQYLGVTFDLVLNPAMVGSRNTLVQAIQKGDEFDAQTQHLASILQKEDRLSTAEQERVLLDLILMTRVLERSSGRFLGLSGGAIEVFNHGRAKWSLNSSTVALEDRGKGPQPSRLELLPGDEIEVWHQGDNVVAVVQKLAPEARPFNRLANRPPWRRRRSLPQLQELVRAQLPGFVFQDLEITRRGVSGRASQMVLKGRSKEREVVEGLAIRWTLDLPDTQFRIHKSSNQEWVFSGKGLGHGVGLCQVGAVAMAQRGHRYREILHHYYTNVQLGRLKATRRRSTE